MPPIPCSLPYMTKALQARHLRGMEVGCGEQRQCVWLPYPHHIEPWCAGVDFLYDVDYRGLISRDELRDETAAEMAASELHPEVPPANGTARLNGTFGALDGVSLPPDAAQQVLVLRGDGGRGGVEPLDWIPLGGFRTLEWRAPFPRRVESVLSAPRPRGLGLSASQLRIVRTCLKSLATSRE